MPTFTAPAPLVVPSFADNSASSGGIPMGLLIFGLGFIGILGLAISFVRGGR